MIYLKNIGFLWQENIMIFFIEKSNVSPLLSFCSGYYFYFVEKDYQEAVKYYRIAADQGHSFAQKNLGECYEYGDGVFKDIMKAINYYRLSENQGNSFAQFNLGYCYESGEGVDQDIKKAIEYYKLSANQGNLFAQFNLGYCRNY